MAIIWKVWWWDEREISESTVAWAFIVQDINDFANLFKDPKYDVLRTGIAASVLWLSAPWLQASDKWFETKSLVEILKAWDIQNPLSIVNAQDQVKDQVNAQIDKDFSFKDNTITLKKTPNNSAFIADTRWVRLTKKDWDFTQTISTWVVWSPTWLDSNGTISSNPNNSSVQWLKTNITLQDNSWSIDWKADFWVTQAISNISGWDTILEASLSTLYAWSQIWTYVLVKKWTDFEKFVLSQWFKIGNDGKLKLTWVLLDRIMGFDFWEYWNKKENIKQTAFWLDYTYNFNWVLNDLKTSVAYFDVKWKNLWTIWEAIKNTPTEYDWTKIEWAIWGGTKLLLWVDFWIKASENLKITLWAWVDKTNYDAVWDLSAQTKTKLTTNIWLEYQPTNYDNFKIIANNQEWSNYVEWRYTHDFGNWIRRFGWASQTKYSQWWISDDNKVFAWLNYSFGWVDQRSKMGSLFHDTKQTGLTHSDLLPNSMVTSDYIVAPIRKAEVENHITNIDKTKFLAWDWIELDSTWHLTRIYFDNWWNTIYSIAWMTDSSYSEFIVVWNDWKLSIVHIEWLSNHMAAQWLHKWDLKDLWVWVNDSSSNWWSIYDIILEKWSVNTHNTTQRVFDLTPSVVNAFINNSLDPRIRSDLLNNTLSWNVVSKIIDWIITQSQVEQYKNWVLTVNDLNNIKSPQELLVLKNGVLAQLPSVNLLSWATSPSDALNAYNQAKTALEVATTQSEIENAITQYNTALSNLNNAITQANTTYNNQVLDQKARALAQSVTTLLSWAIAPDATAYNTAKAQLEAATTIDAIIRAITTYNTALSAYNTAITQANTTYINSLPPPPDPAPSSAPTWLDMTTGSDSGTNNTDNMTSLDPTFTWNTLGLVSSYEIKINSWSRTDIGNITTYTATWLGDMTWATFSVRGKNASGTGPDNSTNFTIDSVTPNTPSLITSVTNKNTLYPSTQITLAVWPSWIDTSWLSVSGGWTIWAVSVSAVTWWFVTLTFDYTTPNAPWDTISISWASGTWKAFSVTVDTAALF